ncbi:hypothetical protein G6F59_018125 [Rhizopus arrhizus]|nr:hypothetical protein G6F59_018125 [Rhizopus arrhizus]
MAARPPGRKGVGRAGACARLAGQARAQARLPDGAGKDRAAKLSGIGQPGAGRLSGPGRSASRPDLPARRAGRCRRGHCGTQAGAGPRQAGPGAQGRFRGAGAELLAR